MLTFILEVENCIDMLCSSVGGAPGNRLSICTYISLLGIILVLICKHVRTSTWQLLQYSKLVLVTCWSNAGHMLVKCWSHAGHMLVTCWSNAGHMHREMLFHMQKTAKISSLSLENDVSSWLSLLLVISAALE